MKIVSVRFLMDASSNKEAEQLVYDIIQPNYKDELIGFDIDVRKTKHFDVADLSDIMDWSHSIGPQFRETTSPPAGDSLHPSEAGTGADPSAPSEETQV